MNYVIINYVCYRHCGILSLMFMNKQKLQHLHDIIHMYNKILSLIILHQYNIIHQLAIVLVNHDGWLDRQTISDDGIVLSDSEDDEALWNNFFYFSTKLLLCGMEPV